LKAVAAFVTLCGRFDKKGDWGAVVMAVNQAPNFQLALIASPLSLALLFNHGIDEENALYDCIATL
jgi:hypothetical protein